MKKILDVCCGSKMFWFNKNNPDVLFGDLRNINETLCDGRNLNIDPDMRFDFRFLPFKSNTFELVVFDPPHLLKVGQNSWMFKKYGDLNKNTWKDDIRDGFSECLRVLKSNRTLIFKWSEIQIKIKEILKLIDCEPLFGHISGKRSDTHWICFMKE